jgi:hypothetical protein
MKTITELNEEYLKKIVKEKDWNSLSWHRGFVEDSSRDKWGLYN